MKGIRVAEMRRLDEAATREYAIPSLLLMENAGRSVCDLVSREYEPCKVLVLIGKGNNGGDGLVVARHLANRGYKVEVALLEDPSKFKADPLLNFTMVRKMKIPRMQISETATEEEVLTLCRKADLVMDAIFGIGLNSPVGGVFETVIRALNKSGKPVVSLDVPSGLDGDTGWVHGVAVKAAWTVALALPKAGFYENEGPQHTGEIEVVDIGLPRELLQPFLS